MSRFAPRYRLTSLRRRVRRLRFERLEIRTLLAAASGPAISEDQAIALALNRYAANEVGTNDFRVSQMGGDVDFDASEPAVAYNSANNEYLVVWRGRDNSGLLNDDFEIFGQRIDAATGMPLGANDFRISDMGLDEEPQLEAVAPAVAYNSADNEYLVVWTGTDDAVAPQNTGEEIYGQRLSAAGAEIGLNDFRISDMGPEGMFSYGAREPAVAYNSADNQYLVVWYGDDDVNNEFEIYAQRLSAAGRSIGDNDFRISQMGPAANTSYGAFTPDVAYNSTLNQYLVVWQADDDSGPLVDNEHEIYGQRLNAAGGEIGFNDFRISVMGSDGNTNFNANQPAVAYNSTDDEYLVVWWGDHNRDEDFEIFAQRLSSSGSKRGAQFRISTMGPALSTAYGAFNPDVAHNSADNEYLVVWHGDDNIAPLVDDEYEIFGQRLSATGAAIGLNDFRISSMGPDGSTSFGAFRPALAYNSTSNEFFAAWPGEDNTPPAVNQEFEIFSQRLEGSGAAVGARLRLSDMGSDTESDAFDAAVAYNTNNNEYLVVWRGDDVVNSPDNEFEIFGQRIDGATGELVGSKDFRISNMGGNDNAAYGAFEPAAAYNSTDNQYLVVWRGDNNGFFQFDDEFEIFGQRLDAQGNEIGTDSRFSVMGPTGSIDYGAFEPAIAYNSTNNSYLLVWRGDHNTGGLVNNEFEIFGQRITSAGIPAGALVRLSDMGPNGDTRYGAFDPAVTYNSTDNQYLIVWRGDDDTAPLVNNEFEIFGQRLGSGGVELGANDLRISDMGPNGNTGFAALEPAAAYNSVDNEYFVVWRGDSNTGALVNNEFEIFGQRLTNMGAEVGTNDLRISNVGSDGDVDFAAFRPAVAYNSTNNEYLVVWHGDDDIAPLVDNEREIFGQRISGAGAALGANDFRISDMGPNGNTAFAALNAAVAYNSASNQWLVAWHGDDNANFASDNELEIFAQRFDHPAALAPLKVSAGLPTVSAGLQTVPAVGAAVPPRSSNAHSPDVPSPPPVAATIDQTAAPSERLIRHVSPTSPPRRPVDAIFADWDHLGAKLAARRK